MDAYVQSKLSCPSHNQVSQLEGGFCVTREQLKCLEGQFWLNDEVINFYFHLIVAKLPKVYAFGSHFFPKLKSSGFKGVARWTKNVDLFSQDYILIPIHLGSHWCLAVVDVNRQSINYYDSLGGKPQYILDLLGDYLEEEFQTKRKSQKSSPFGFGKYFINNIPQQENADDCGVFMCMFADLCSKDGYHSALLSPDFVINMESYRKKMLYSIIMQKLI